jgi:major membrane immunogen (membrane-anchored lipoprotein)
MKRWISAGILAAILILTGCASNGYYGRNYRYDRDYRYRNYRDGRYRYNYDRHRDHDWYRDRDRRDDRDYWRYR